MKQVIFLFFALSLLYFPKDAIPIERVKKSDRSVKDDPVSLMQKQDNSNTEYEFSVDLIERTLKDKPLNGIGVIYITIGKIEEIVESESSMNFEEKPYYLEEDSPDYYKNYLHLLSIKVLDSDFFQSIFSSINSHVSGNTWTETVNGESLGIEKAMFYLDMLIDLSKRFLDDYIDQDKMDCSKYESLEESAAQISGKAEELLVKLTN